MSGDATNSLIRIGFTIAGSYFGPWGTYIGSMVGGLVADAVAPPSVQEIEGPKPSSTGITTSAYGTPIPIVLGANVVTGQVVDGEPEIEVVKNTESVGGKGGILLLSQSGGGQPVTTYSTFGTFMLLLAEVPEPGAVYDLARLWWNGKIVYDRRHALLIASPDDPLRTGDDIDDKLTVGTYFGGLKSGIYSSLAEGIDDGSFAAGVGNGGLTWSYAGGVIQSLDTDYQIPAGDVGLADNATNFVYATNDGSGWRVVATTEGYFGTANDVPLWEVITQNGQQLYQVDFRRWVNRQSLYQRAAVSDEIEGYFTYYNGADDQDPDPTLESIHGVGNVPGYRGFSYIMFDRLPLTDAGHRIGLWEAELVLRNQSTRSETQEFLRGKVLYPWRSAKDPINIFNQHEAQAGANQATGTTYTGDARSAINAAIAETGRPDSVLLGWAEHDGELSGYYNTGITPRNGSPGDLRDVYLHYALVEPDFYSPAQVSLIDWADLPVGTLFWSGSNSDSVPQSRVGLNYIGRNFSEELPGGGQEPFEEVDAPPNKDLWNRDAATAHYDVPGGKEKIVLWKRADTVVRVRRIPKYPGSGCEPPYEAVAHNPQWCVNRETGDYQPNLMYGVEQGTFWAVSDYATAQGYAGLSPMPEDAQDQHELVTSYPMDPVVRDGHPLADTPQYPAELTEAQVATLNLNVVVVRPITLAEVLRLISKLSGITASNIDTSQVSGNVWGITLNGGAGRQYIEMLRAWGWFDSIESEGKVKFRSRAAAPVMTVNGDDTGASDDGDASRLDSARTEDYELPQEVRVGYPSLNADYEQGMQYAERQITVSQNIRSLNVRIPMTDLQGKRIAQVVLNEAWRQRNERETRLPRYYDIVEPADTLTLTMDGVGYRFRATEKTYQDSVFLRCVDDDAAEYQPLAFSAEVYRNSTVSQPAGPTNLVVLDLPALQDDHTGAGYYVALWGPSSAWPGGAFQVSADGGTTWDTKLVLDTKATIGKVVAPPRADAPSTIIDYGSAIEVELMVGDLSSASSDLAFLNGAENVAAIGADGRWLIVSFRYVAELSNGNFELTHLLVGRLGTEHNIRRVRVQDQFVLLDTALGRAQIQNAMIGSDLRIRAATIGAPAPDDNDQFIPQAVNLTPFSPVQIKGARNDDGDLTVTWRRRTRLGGGWQLYPLYEESEEYEVEFLYPGTEGSVVRTETISGITSLPKYIYSAADQQADFEDGQTQAALLVRIYQISAVIGRGYVGEAVL